MERRRMTDPEVLQALDARLEDPERWALRQTCADLRARYADRTSLSLHQRPELLPHAIDSMAPDVLDANRSAALCLCASLGEIPSLSRLIEGADAEQLMLTCFQAAKSGRIEAVRCVRAARADLPWGLSDDPSINLIVMASVFGKLDFAEQVRLDGCPLVPYAATQACLSGDAAALEWYFTHAPAVDWSICMPLDAMRKGHICVVEWAVARGFDIHLQACLAAMESWGELEQRDAMLRWAGLLGF